MATRAKKTAIIGTLAEWYALDASVGVIIMKSNSFNDGTFKTMDMTRFVNLVGLVVGDESCMYVNELRLIGLNELEIVVIGMNSFTKYRSTSSITADPNRHFYLKNCPKLKSLKMGRYSFSDYSVCEIENVNALEVIEMGNANNLDEESCIFHYASLELRSILIHSK